MNRHSYWTFFVYFHVNEVESKRAPVAVLLTTACQHKQSQGPQTCHQMMARGRETAREGQGESSIIHTPHYYLAPPHPAGSTHLPFCKSHKHCTVTECLYLIVIFVLSQYVQGVTIKDPAL